MELDDSEEFCELLAIRDSVFVVTENVKRPRATADLLRVEGLLSFHVRLAGSLLIEAGTQGPAQIGAPSLLVWHQRAEGGRNGWSMPGRSLSVTILCRPAFIRAALALSELAPGRHEAVTPGRPHYRQLPATSEIISASRNLTSSPCDSRLHLLQREAKALELYCHILSAFDRLCEPTNERYSERDQLRLHRAREILSSRFHPVPTINAIAREVGINETKLKRGFRDVFGKTVFDYGRLCRMEQAMRLLRDKHLPISLVASAVGYSHQTSFASAFKSHFGYQPKEVRRPSQVTRDEGSIERESAC